MKKLLLVCVILGTKNIFAGAPDTMWTRTYGKPYPYIDAYSICQTNDGNFIVAEPGVMKIKPNGDTIWTRSYTVGNYAYCYSASQTEDGGFIITGFTYSNNYDVYLARTNTIGDTMWTKIYGGANGDEGYSALQMKNGGFIIAGYTGSFGPGNRVYIIGTDCNGDSLWAKAFGGTTYSCGCSMCEAQDSGFVIAGGKNNSSVYVVKIDCTGDTMWTRAYGSCTRGAYSICQFSPERDSGFIIVGDLNAGRGIYLLRINSNGDSVWTKTYSKESTAGYSICRTQDGGFVIAGGTYVASSYDDYLYLMKTNCYGDSLWTGRYRTLKYLTYYYDCRGYSICQAKDGTLIVVGKASHSDNYVYVVRFKHEIAAEESNTPTVFSCKSYPNPVSSNLSVEYSLPGSNTLSEQEVKLTIYDISGTRIKTLVNETQPIGKHIIHWNGKDDANRKVSAGIYFYSLSAGNYKSINKFILMKH
ncbi:MAG: T9SS type A sorting domain-containing protein [bacterium]